MTRVRGGGQPASAWRTDSRDCDTAAEPPAINQRPGDRHVPGPAHRERQRVSTHLAPSSRAGSSGVPSGCSMCLRAGAGACGGLARGSRRVTSTNVSRPTTGVAGGRLPRYQHVASNSDAERRTGASSSAQCTGQRHTRGRRTGLAHLDNLLRLLPDARCLKSPQAAAVARGARRTCTALRGRAGGNRW